MQGVSVARPKKAKPSKRQKTETPSTDAQQIILDAINILQLKMADLTQKVQQLEDASAL